MTRDVDWLRIGRYALMTALTEFIPVPLLDGFVENVLRRRLVRRLAQDAGVGLSDDDVRILADAPSSGCLGLVRAVLIWPFKKLLRLVFFFLTAKTMADRASDVVHRSLMLQEALVRGWLPGDATRLRQGMDVALEKIDVRVVERALLGAFRDNRNELNRVVWEATRVARARKRGERADALADATEQDELGEEADSLGALLTDRLREAGVAEEALHWFLLEMQREGEESVGASRLDVRPAVEPEQAASAPEGGPSQQASDAGSSEGARSSASTDAASPEPEAGDSDSTDAADPEPEDGDSDAGPPDDGDVER